ncbi:MAG TPA: hypothetical protein VKW78_21955 [Terriglobales bacterium]|nr:hypothetical protein [Terriglobales bacterium]
MHRVYKLQLALVLLLSVFTLAADSAPSSASLERPFMAAGKITLQLSAGGYVIRGTKENRIYIELDPSQVSEVRAELKVDGNQAYVRLKGPQNNFHATIFVPQQSDLIVNQTVGDMRIQAVQGNKSVDLDVGSLKIDVPAASDYSNVDATVRIGSIKAPAWKAQHDGFFRSLQAHGQGKYNLNAHVGVGDMTLSEAERL